MVVFFLLPILLLELLVTKGTLCDKEMTDGSFSSVDLKKKRFTGTETRLDWSRREGLSRATL